MNTYIFKTDVGHRGIAANTELEARNIAESRFNYGEDIELVRVEPYEEQGAEESE